MSSIREIFEACAVELLRPTWPGIVAVRGGADEGFDGAVADADGAPFPLVSTVSAKAVDNLSRNLDRVQQGANPTTRAIFATPRRVTPTLRRALAACAETRGVTLVQTCDQDFFAHALYRHSGWCKRLLGLSGRPSALSVYPVTSRPLFGNALRGRDEELEWLRTTPGDVLLLGGPGTGKTALAHELAQSGEALFLIDPDREALANALRDGSVPAVIVDDAHLDSRRLTDLVQLRQDVGAHFRIIATSWPLERAAVRTALQVPTTSTRDLPLMGADTVIEIIKEVGLFGPPSLLRLIRQQAEGRPGLAVTLAHLCLGGDVLPVARGDSLFEQWEPALDRMLPGATSINVLAAFALGGNAGTAPDSVVEYLGLTRLELGTTLARLDAAGIVRESSGGALSVWPMELRWALVRRAFFGSSGPALPHAILLERVARLGDAVTTLVAARARGAAIPDLATWVERADTSRNWAEFARLGPDEARHALDGRAMLSSDVVAATLQHVPDTAIPRLLDSARDDSRLASATTDHGLRCLETWTMGGSLNGGGMRRRRQALAQAVGRWCDAPTAETGTALGAFRLALSPTFERWESDPGQGRVLTREQGLLSTADILALSELWPIARGVLERSASPIRWGDLEPLVRAWLYPEPPVPEAEERTRRVVQDTAVTMLEDLARITMDQPGLQRQLDRLAARAGIDLETTRDADFDELYPRERPTSSGMEVGTSLDGILARWRELDTDEVAERLSRIEAQARDAGLSYPRRTPDLCCALARQSADPLDVGRTFVRHRLPESVVKPFLREAMQAGGTGVDAFLLGCLDDPTYRRVVLHVALSAPSPSPPLLEGALAHADEWPEIVHIECLRGAVARSTLERLLAHSRASVAFAAAVGCWEADDKGLALPLDTGVWREAILRSADEPTRQSGLEYRLEQIFESDPSIACEWLHARIRSSRPLGILDDEPSVESAAISSLDRSQRWALIDASLAHANNAELVRLLVGSDASLYAELLQNTTSERHHLAPLSGPIDLAWRERACAALDAGYSPGIIAEMAIGQSHGWGPEPESAMWAAKRDLFLSLVDAPGARLSEVSDAGTRITERARQQALERERRDDVYGS